MLNPNFAIIGALLIVVGFIGYARDTLKGKTQPNRVSWLLWGIAPLITFAAELTQRVGLQSIYTFAAGLGPILILIISFVDRKAYWKLTKFDIWCGILSALALALWAITGKGDVAIIFSILADILASIPTIIKSYKAPETESANIYIAAVAGAVITLLTVDNWTLANYAFPFNIILTSGIIAILVLFPKVRFKKS